MISGRETEHRLIENQNGWLATKHHCFPLSHPLIPHVLLSLSSLCVGKLLSALFRKVRENIAGNEQRGFEDGEMHSTQRAMRWPKTLQGTSYEPAKRSLLFNKQLWIYIFGLKKKIFIF